MTSRLAVPAIAPVETCVVDIGKPQVGLHRSAVPCRQRGMVVVRAGGRAVAYQAPVAAGSLLVVQQAVEGAGPSVP